VTPIEITLMLIFLYPTIVVIYSIFEEASKINKEKE